MRQSTPNGRQRFWHWAGLITVVWLGFGLLLWNLDARGLWLDEIIYVELERQGPASIVNGLMQEFTDHHPPAYHFIAHFWLTLAGESDFAARMLSVFFGVMCLPLLYQIGRIVRHPRLGKLAALLLAMAPLAIMFTRIARYYALTTMLGLLTTLLFLRLGRERRIRAAYIVASALLAYTDYLGLSLLVGQGYLALFANKRRKGFFWRWMAGEIIAALLFVPWFFVFIRQASSAATWSAADLAFSPVGYLLKVAYPLYAFSVGTTLFPWDPIAFVGGIVLGGLAILGVLALARQRGPWGSNAHVIVAFIMIPFVIVFLVVSFVTPLVPFIAIPDHMIFAVPFFCLLLAAGWERLPHRWLRIVASAIVVVTYGAAYANYLAGADFHNPVYAVPIADAVELVIANSEPGDVIVSKRDTGFAYHHAKREAALPYYEIDHEIFALIDDVQPARMWVISFGRDRTLGGDLTPEFIEAALAQGYTEIMHQGYVEQNATYRMVKEKLLNRPAYRYKLEVRLLAR